MIFLKKYIITLVIFFVIDILWLGLVAKNFYRENLGFIMVEKFNWPAAILFYSFYIIGILFFVVNPALERESIRYAIFVGAFFGMITYGTYDMTNLATLKNWPINVTIVDIIWGTILCSLTSSLSYLAINNFIK